MMDALEAGRRSGLVQPGVPLMVMLSGGGDSVCLLDVSLRLGARVSALHVNHGLRDAAADDEAFVRRMCERLGVPLVVETLEPPPAGNLQDWAREARYALAERHAEADYAAAHTASDQAETVLYRLAVSPGSRALQGMPARRGRLVRPLLDRHPRRGPGLPAGARAGVARGSHQRRPALCPSAGAPRRAALAA